jgi:hypothetical protein
LRRQASVGSGSDFLDFPLTLSLIHPVRKAMEKGKGEGFARAINKRPGLASKLVG